VLCLFFFDFARFFSFFARGIFFFLAEVFRFSLTRIGPERATRMHIAPKQNNKKAKKAHARVQKKS
jgi:hypothetical protein